jgi:hypothetical protein
MLTVISEKAYLIIFSIVMSVIVVLLLAWIIPKGLLEYNFGISIVTSLLSTEITVIVLNLLLTIREEREWNIVKKNAYARIGMELGLLFAELLRFTENEIEEFGFKSSLLYTKDSKIRKEMIFSKLSELQKKEPLQLTPSSVSMFRSDKGLFVFLSDIKRNLGDVQIRYERHLTPKITERLIRVQGFLELMNRTYELDTMLNKLQNQLPLLRELMHKLMPQMHDQNLSSLDLIQNVLPTCIKSLIQETYALWKLGIEFDLA